MYDHLIDNKWHRTLIIVLHNNGEQFESHMQHIFLFPYLFYNIDVS